MTTIFTEAQINQIQSVITAAVHDLRSGVERARDEIESVGRKMQQLDGKIADLESSMQDNNEQTLEIREAFDFAKKGLRMLGALGSGVKWLVGLSGPVIAAYAWWKDWRK